MSPTRTETLVITGVDKAGNSSAAVNIPLTFTSASAGLFAGDPGPGNCCYGLCHQGGMADMAARAADFAKDLGQTTPVYPKGGRVYITPFGASGQSTAQNIADGITKAKKALADAAIVKAFGGLPFIDTKEMYGLDFAKVGAGGMDQFIDFLMEGAVALNWPMIIGYHQEPAGDNVGGTVETGTAGAKAYGSALDRFAARRDLAGGKGNVSVTGCIGLGAFPSATGAGKFGTILPWFQYAEAASDTRGTHKYLQYASQDEAKWSKGWSMDELFGQFWDLQDSVDSTVKAHVHGEWGVHTRAANLATAPLFMDQMLTYGIAHLVRAMFNFDSGLNVNAGGPWTLDCPIQGAVPQVIDISRRKHFAVQLTDKRVVGPSLALAA